MGFEKGFIGWRVTRKAFRCSGCGVRIPAKSSYWRFSPPPGSSALIAQSEGSYCLPVCQRNKEAALAEALHTQKAEVREMGKLNKAVTFLKPVV